MNISLYFSQLRTRIEQYIAHDDYVQTSNTGLVALVAICMIFVSFVSNKPGSMAPLLQANIQNAWIANQAFQQADFTEEPTIILNGIEYTLIRKR